MATKPKIPEKEPKVDMKALDQITKKVLAYQPKKKPRAAPNPESAARK